MLWSGRVPILPDLTKEKDVAKRQDFTDERVSKKQRKLDKQRREKALKKSEKETQKALNDHRLGWQDRSGKEW